MAKMNYRKKSFGIIMFLMMLILLGTRAQAAGHPATGLEDTDEEQFRKFINSIPEITKVHLNEEAIRAIREYEKENNLEMQELECVKKGDEMEFAENPTKVQSQENEDFKKLPYLIPTYHDVSIKDTFPPIKNQGKSGSCTAWAMGYYQMTNNLANIRGENAKTDSSKWISPAWLYNLIRAIGDENAGSSYNSAEIVILKQGVPYWTDFDGATTETNYTSWNPDPVVWEKALNNRMESFSSISLVDSTGELDLKKLQETLLDGYVVNFSCRYKNQDGWDMSNTCITDPIEEGYPDHRGEWVMKAVYRDKNNKKNNSGHAMTIVGWDDKIQIDYDGDGKPDTEGALKIANSWGDGSDKINDTPYNNGFFWLAYDAIKSNSRLDIKSERVPAIQDQKVFFLEPRKSYTPLLVAEVTMETNCRKELALSFGVSSQNTTIATNRTYAWQVYSNELVNYSYTIPFWYKNYKDDSEKVEVNYDFYGKTLASSQRSSATFTFDLSDLLSLYKNNLKKSQKIRLYFKIFDNEKDGYSNALKKIVVKDKTSRKTVSKTVDLVVDGDNKETYIDYDIDTWIVDDDKEFSMTFNYPIQQTSIKKDITISDYRLNNTLSLLPDRTYSTDRKQIALSPLDGGYETGHYYSLNINVKSDGGNSLVNKNKYYFYRLKEAS